MKKLWVYLFPFFISTSLFAEEDVVVYLSTQQNLHNVYIAPFKKNSPISEEYSRMLRDVLAEDFELDGRSHVISQNYEINKRFQQKPIAEAFHQDTLKQLKIQNLIHGRIEKNQLTLSCFDALTKETTELKPIILSSDFKTDAHQIHCLADQIHQHLYGVDGIARTKILFSYHPPNQSSKIENWTSEIYLMDYSGANLTQITKEDSYCICPQFFPDRNQFMYVSYKNGQPKIYYTSVGQMKGKAMVHLRGNQLLPTISKQSDLIAYISDASGRPDLFIQQFDPDKGTQSKPIQIYSYPQSVQASPTFNADGTQLAFVSDKDRVPKIYILDVRNSLTSNKLPQVRCLTTKKTENTCPSWSPDGTKIAYSAKKDGVRQIWIYDFETKTDYQLTTGPGNKENPSWAPNNLHLVYNTTSPESDLYIIDLNKRKPTKITKGEGLKHYPSWETMSKNT